MTEPVRIPVRDGRVADAKYVYALVDPLDAASLVGYRWHLTTGYARRTTFVGGRGGKQVSILMHREIMANELGRGQEVDHINRDKLDNRRENLRVVTRAQNKQNLDNYRGGSSQYRGVSWDKGRNKWIAAIRVDNKRYMLGRFVNEHEAGRIAAEARAAMMTHSQEAA